MRVVLDVGVKDCDGVGYGLCGVKEFDGIFGELGRRGAFANGIERAEERGDFVVHLVNAGVVLEVIVEIHMMEPRTEALRSRKDVWAVVEQLRRRDFGVGVDHGKRG